jgi:hypothetical protein
MANNNKYEQPPMDFGKDWRETREKEWPAEQAAQAKKPKGKILVYPNPNDEGFEDNWVCEHIGCQVAKADGEVWLCGSICADKAAAGAEIVKVSGAAR